MSFTKKLLAVAIAGIGCQSAYAAEDANTVVVTATLRNHNIASAPAFTTVITAEDIAKAPVNSLGDVLRETVGVNNMTDGTGRDEIQIRGLSGKYTLMLVNGKRTSSGGALWRGGDFDVSSIPLSSIKRVEIVRGPMAALYGSDAMGGVINIITKTPSTDWTGVVSADYRVIGSGVDGDQYRLGAAVSGAVNDRLSLSIAGESYDRKPWFSALAPTERPPRLEEKQSQNLVTTATLKLSETQSIDLDLGYNKDKRPYGMYAYSYNAARKVESKSYRADDITRYTLGLTHKALWDWGSTTALLSREEARINDFSSSYNAPQQRVLKEINTYAKFYGNTVSGIHSLTGGVDLRRQLVKDPVSYQVNGQIQTDTSALFGEDEIALSKDLSLTLAGRLDHSDAFGKHVTPKTYLSYQLNDEVTVKGGVNKAFRAPEAYQLAKDYRIVSCGGGCMLSGNPDLTPEKSTNYELGVEFHRKGLNATAVVFQNDVSDMIVALYNPAGPSRKWANVTKAKTKGVELQGDMTLNAAWSVNGNYTRLNAESINETGATVQLENRPKNLANVGVNWNVNAWLQSSLSAHYTGEQLYNNVTLPAYTRADFALSARVNKNVTLRAGVKNLSNVNLDEKSKTFTTFELARNYYVSAAYSF